MARLIHKAWRNSVETRAGFATPSVLPAGIVAATRDPVPAMPCVANAPSEHRPKMTNPYNHYGAFIARTLSRKEMLDNKDAYQALQDEAKAYQP